MLTISNHVKVEAIRVFRIQILNKADRYKKRRPWYNAVIKVKTVTSTGLLVTKFLFVYTQCVL